MTVKKGDVNVMTYEDLPGGGWVITSGRDVLRNYDIKSVRIMPTASSCATSSTP